MSRKILVVDDEQILVDTIAYNLQQAGYQVTTAADGASASWQRRSRPREGQRACRGALQSRGADPRRARRALRAGG